MKILVTNDDGINSYNLKLLVQELLYFTKDILVVAPNSEKSGVSQSLTIRRGIKCVKEPDIVEGIETYSINANPTDCVRLAICALNYECDIVVSGINNGYNMGYDILYSGTVGAATQAAMMGKQALALSFPYGDSTGIRYVRETLIYIFNEQLLEKSEIINVNIPSTSIGIKMTIQGTSTYQPYFVLKDDGLYYSRIKHNALLDNEGQTDLVTVNEGYISITPLKIKRNY